MNELTVEILKQIRDGVDHLGLPGERMDRVGERVDRLDPPSFGPSPNAVDVVVDERRGCERPVRTGPRVGQSPWGSRDRRDHPSNPPTIKPSQQRSVQGIHHEGRLHRLAMVSSTI